MVKPIMILAGGTGGHIFPALAVAQELIRLGKSVVWVGVQNSMEAEVVPNAGIPFITIHVQGLRRSGWRRYLKAPFILGRAMIEAIAILRRQKPCAVLGMGGFVAGPCGLMSVLFRIPLVLHEQNSIPGLTNRLLAPFCSYFFTGFPITVRNRDTIYSGNPVRKSLERLSNTHVRGASSRSGPIHLLVLGGSQGAHALNRFVPAALARMDATLRPVVWHQTGKGNEAVTRARYESCDVEARVETFIYEMENAYQWADLVICRSGAMTLAEISAVGLASILVPYPYAVDDHQTKNAESFVQAGAALLISEHELNDESLAAQLNILVKQRPRLGQMADAAHMLTVSDASSRIAQACIEVCKAK